MKDKEGKFKEGNSYWENRKKHGKPKAVESPERLWELFCDYAQKVDDNPKVKIETKSGVDGDKTKSEQKQIIQSRPYTWDAFEDHLFENEVISDLRDYKANKDDRYTDYAYIISHISKIIYNNKFEGALLGNFNANLVARELGISDKKEITGKDGKDLIPPTSYANLSDEELIMMSELEKKARKKSE